MLASWGAGFGIKGRLDQLVEGAVGVMRGWPPCLGRSEPGPGWQGGAAQELGQGKCSVKVRVRAVGLSEGRGGCSESTGGAGSGGPGGGASASRRPAAPPGGRAGAAPAPSAAGQGHRAQEGHSRDFRKPAALLNCCSARPPPATPPLPLARSGSGAGECGPGGCSRRPQEGRRLQRTGGRGRRTGKGRTRPGRRRPQLQGCVAGRMELPPRALRGRSRGRAWSPCPSDRGRPGASLIRRQERRGTKRRREIRDTCRWGPARGSDRGRLAVGPFWGSTVEEGVSLRVSGFGLSKPRIRQYRGNTKRSAQQGTRWAPVSAAAEGRRGAAGGPAALSNGGRAGRGLCEGSVCRRGARCPAAASAGGGGGHRQQARGAQGALAGGTVPCCCSSGRWKQLSSGEVTGATSAFRMPVRLHVGRRVKQRRLLMRPRPRATRGAPGSGRPRPPPRRAHGSPTGERFLSAAPSC